MHPLFWWSTYPQLLVILCEPSLFILSFFLFLDILLAYFRFADSNYPLVYPHYSPNVMSAKTYVILFME